MFLRLSLAILFYLVYSNTILAGTISIQGSPQVQFELEEDMVTVSGHVEFINLGDEMALDVFPELRIGSWQWKGDGHNLNPNEKYNWRIHEEVSLSKWQCIKELCKDFSLPLMGSYPMEFYRHYHDMNGYPFSLIIVKNIFIGTEAIQLIDLHLEGQLEITSYRNSFTANFSLENLSNEQLDVLVILKSTKAIFIPENQEKLLNMSPHAKKALTFHGETRKALLNSVHDIFAITLSKVKATPQTGKDNEKEFRGLKIFSSQYHVIKSKRRIYYWLLGVLGALIFSIFIVQIKNEDSHNN